MIVVMLVCVVTHGEAVVLLVHNLVSRAKNFEGKMGIK